MENKSANYLATLSAFLYVCAGISGMVVALGLYQSFGSLEAAGAPDALALSDGISFAMYGQMGGLIALILGAICLSITLFRFKLRVGWLWWTVMLSSFLALPLVSLGTIISLATLIYLRIKKAEFFP